VVILPRGRGLKPFYPFITIPRKKLAILNLINYCTFTNTFGAKVFEDTLAR